MQQSSRRMDIPGIEAVCRQLAAEQDQDGFSWGELCLEDGDGAPIRVLSPTHDPEGFKTYFDDYIYQVWQYIASNGINPAWKVSKPTSTITSTKSGSTSRATAFSSIRKMATGWFHATSKVRP